MMQTVVNEFCLTEAIISPVNRVIGFIFNVDFTFKDSESKWLRSVKPQQGLVSAGTTPQIVYSDLSQPLCCWSMIYF